MPQKHKKKAYTIGEEPEVEIITQVEVIYEDTKAIMGVVPKYKWGEIYQMISNQSVPDVRLEDLPIYDNIKRSAIKRFPYV